MYKVTSPVSIIVFNRPDLTAKLISRLQEVDIERLYVILDGPRNEEDIHAINKIKAMLKSVNLAKYIEINQSPINLGCKRRVISGLNWVFNQVESSIILEDDCIPDVSFFEFCDELLEKYRNDERIGIISGSNLVSTEQSSSSYSYSKYSNIWGWASWRRTWLNYDEHMKIWDSKACRENFKFRCFSSGEYRYWNAVFNQTKDGLINTWDYQLWLSTWMAGQLSIVPNVNLVDNLGFKHEKATHTGTSHPAPNIKAGKIIPPFKPPLSFQPNVNMDRKINKLLYQFQPVYIRAINKILRFLSSWKNQCVK